MSPAALNTLIIDQNQTKKEVGKLRTSKNFFMEARAINFTPNGNFSCKKDY